MQTANSVLKSHQNVDVQKLMNEKASLADRVKQLTQLHDDLKSNISQGLSLVLSVSFFLVLFVCFFLAFAVCNTFY
jgi:hypothetical protein